MKKDMVEFMFQFDGAMTVIHEAEEPSEEMTRKHSR